MSDIYSLKTVEHVPVGMADDHVWTRRAERFLRGMRMMRAPSDVIAELLYDLLDIIEPHTDDARFQIRRVK